jgi:hypothetical protein
VAHTHALSDFKHLLRSGIDAFAHPTWRQTEVEPVDDELIALFKAHPNVPVMPGFWTPRNEIYGARPYWLDDPMRIRWTTLPTHAGSRASTCEAGKSTVRR